MKKVLIISDTHMPKFGKIVPNILLKYIKKVDLIIHAGDFQKYDIYKEFKKYKEIIAVYGNNDDKRLKQELKQKEILNIDNIKIGIYHGHGVLSKGKNSLKRAMIEFKDEELDIVIFGHSHQP